VATPTFAELTTQLQNIADLYKEARIFASTGTAADTFVGMQDALTQSLEGDYSGDIMQGVAALRASLNSILTNPAPLNALWGDFGRFLGVPEGANAQDVITYLFEYMEDNAETIESRAMVYGSVTPDGGNVGDGVPIRLTEDQYGNSPENIVPETKTVICTSDANTGATRNREQFELRGEDPGRDNIEQMGSGLVFPITAREALSGLLLNPSFDQFGGPAATPTSLTNWINSATGDSTLAGDGTDVIFDSTNIYNPTARASETRYSMDVQATRTFSQRIDVRGTGLSRFIPYYSVLAYNDMLGSGGAFTGSLDINMGSITNTVALTGVTGWGLLPIVASPDSTLWYSNFAADELELDLVVTRTSGSLIVDDYMFIGMDAVDGSWYVWPAGQTPFRAGSIFGSDGDRWTIADAIATDAVIQRLMAELFDRYLPASGAPTIPDP